MIGPRALHTRLQLPRMEMNSHSSICPLTRSLLLSSRHLPILSLFCSSRAPLLFIPWSTGITRSSDREFAISSTHSDCGEITNLVYVVSFVWKDEVIKIMACFFRGTSGDGMFLSHERTHLYNGLSSPIDSNLNET